jgi:hypothetical protein
MFFSTIIGITAVLAATLAICVIIANKKRLSDGMEMLWITVAVLFSIIIALFNQQNLKK